MTETVADTEKKEEAKEQQPSNKELNFRALEAKYKAELEKERAARLEAERAAQQKRQQEEEDDDDDEPYIDKKRLEKKLAKFGEHTQKLTQSEIQKAVNTALADERKQNWLKQNNDFYEVLQNADKLAERDPDLAESILEMPESFERQKLVYKNIKALGLHKPPEKENSLQDKIAANRRSPYYQPSGVGTSPYASGGDFSREGQKNAYAKMKELKARLGV